MYCMEDDNDTSELLTDQTLPRDIGNCFVAGRRTAQSFVGKENLQFNGEN